MQQRNPCTYFTSILTEKNGARSIQKSSASATRRKTGTEKYILVHTRTSPNIRQRWQITVFFKMGRSMLNLINE